MSTWIDESDRKIVVGPETYQVSNSLEIEEEALVRIQQGRILHANDLGPDRLKIALCHEVSHIILNGLCLDETVEERACEWIGRALVSFLRDNPAFVAWVQETENKPQNNALVLFPAR